MSNDEGWECEQWPQCNDWCHGWGCQLPLTTSDLHSKYIESVWAHWDDAVDEFMGEFLQCSTSMYDNELRFFKKLAGWGWAEMLSWCHRWSYQPTLITASHIHIIYIGSVWAHWDAVDELMGTSLQCSGSDHEPGFYENLKSEGEQ